MMATNGSLAMPKTKTPVGVFLLLVAMAGLGGVLLSTLLGFWGFILLFVVLGITVGVYTETVPGFHARIVLNHLTSKQRTIFQGLHPKLPWETLTRDIDLRVDLKEVLTDTYASLDAQMETKYVYTMRPNFRGNAGANVILYASYETDALKQSIRALLSMCLSDYYGKHSGTQLLDKLTINKEVFEEEPGGSLVEKFEENHGVAVTVRLEDSDFDAATQTARDTVSRAQSFSNAVKKLTDGGMDRPEAEKVAKLMNLPGVQEYIISLKADGLENLRDVTLLPPGLGGKKK
jgi:hypothetical protein